MFTSFDLQNHGKPLSRGLVPEFFTIIALDRGKDMASQTSQNETAANFKQRLLFLFIFAITFSFAPKNADATATPTQVSVIQNALNAKIAQQSALMLVAHTLMASPNVALKTAGRAQLAAATAQLGNLQNLMSETKSAAANGKNPPQAAVDVAFKHVADQLSKATQDKQFHLLPLYAAQLGQLTSLNNQIQGGAIPTRTVASLPGGPATSAQQAISRVIAVTAVQRARQEAARQQEIQRQKAEALRLQQASSWGRGVAR